jgi:hypothetical protein
MSIITKTSIHGQAYVKFIFLGPAYVETTYYVELYIQLGFNKTTKA